MDIETHRVKLIHRSDRTASAIFCFDDEAEDCTLTLQSPEGEFKSDGVGLFRCALHNPAIT